MGRDEQGNDSCPAGMACSSDETPRRRQTARTFALDTFEVTVGRFRNFLAAL